MLISRLMYASSLARDKAKDPVDLDCCVHNMDVISHVYKLNRGNIEDAEADWMIYRDPDGYVPVDRVFGPVQAVVDLLLAEDATVRVPGGTYQVQAWTQLRPDGRAGPPETGDRGHTFIWHETAPDIGLVIESDRYSGIRWRGPMKWADVVKARPHIRIAKLLPPGGKNAGLG